MVIFHSYVSLPEGIHIIMLYIYMYLYDLDKCRTFDPLLNIVGLVDALDPLRCAKIAKLHCHWNSPRLFFGTPEDENKTPQPINYWNNILNELSIINILKDLKVNYQIEKRIINLSMNYIYFRILLFYLKIGLCYPHPVSWPSVHQGEWRLSLATSPCLRIQLGHGNPSLSLAVSENFGEKS